MLRPRQALIALVLTGGLGGCFPMGLLNGLIIALDPLAPNPTYVGGAHLSYREIDFAPWHRDCDTPRLPNLLLVPWNLAAAATFEILPSVVVLRDPDGFGGEADTFVHAQVVQWMPPDFGCLCMDVGVRPPPDRGALIRRVIRAAARDEPGFVNVGSQELDPLAELGADAERVLREEIGNTSAANRAVAVTLLADMPPSHSVSTSDLLALQDDGERDVRLAAALAWPRSVEPPPRVVASLRDGLSDSRRVVRWEFVSVVGQWGAGAPSLGPAFVPTLLSGLDDPDRVFAARAARALGEWGAAAFAAVPKLRSLASGNDPEVSPAASRALQKIESRAGGPSAP